MLIFTLHKKKKEFFFFSTTSKREKNPEEFSGFQDPLVSHKMREKKNTKQNLEKNEGPR